MSLRGRLLIAVLLVTAAGLLAADLATYRFLGSFLFDRVDSQLAIASGLGEAMFRIPVPQEGPPATGAPPFPSGTYVELLDGSGTLTDRRVVTLGQDSPSPPDLPTGLPGSDTGPTGRALLTVDSMDGSLRYRVLALASANGTLVAAIPLTDVGETLRRLVVIESIVTAGTLALLVGLSWWLVRLGLRPLVQMEQVAGSIAAGDLSRRVEPATDRTEVGRLGLALNTMLVQIESSFAERRASEARLSRFVADASHELRTPLTSIRGYAELSRHEAGARPEILHDAMRHIELESKRMGELVDELALLARLNEGRPLAREPRDLVEIAAAAVGAARMAFPARTIDLESPRSLTASVDGNRYRQILDNLLWNAAEHTPEGCAVHVRLHGDRRTALLEVEDEGQGIPREHVDRLFERFYRADPSRSRGTGGSGLGLSIVRAIAEAHGGSARYERGTHGGARFEVRIPIIQTPVAQPDESSVG